MNRSALCSLVRMRWTSISPDLIMDRNQWYLTEICLVRAVIRGPLLLARFWVPVLSSQDFETRDMLSMLSFIRVHNSLTNRRAETRSLIPWLSAMYSDSRVETEISDWSVELHRIGTSPNVIKISDRLFTDLGSSFASTLYRPTNLHRQRGQVPCCSA